MITIKCDIVIGITYSNKSFIAFDYNDKSISKIDNVIRDKFNIPNSKESDYFPHCIIALFLSIPMICTFIFKIDSERYGFLDALYGIACWIAVVALVFFSAIHVVDNRNLLLSVSFYKNIALSLLLIIVLGTIKSEPENSHYKILYKNDYFGIAKMTALKDIFDKDNALSYIKINKNTTKSNLEKQIFNLKLKYRLLSLNHQSLFFKILEIAYKKDNRNIINYLINDIYPSSYKTKNKNQKIAERILIKKIIKFNDLENMKIIKTFKEVDDLSELIKFNNDALIYYIENMKMTELQLESYKGIANFYKSNEVIKALNEKII